MWKSLKETLPSNSVGDVTEINLGGGRSCLCS